MNEAIEEILESAEVINGTNNSDHIIKRDTNANIYGLDGDDHFNIYGGHYFIDGGTGANTLFAYFDADIGHVQVSKDDDVYTIYAYSQSVSFTNISDVNFRFLSTTQNFYIYDINELLIIQDGQSIAGTNNKERLTGTTGNDLIQGYADNDIINGSAGNDIIYGGEGNDWIQGAAGDDYLDGGIGIDTLYISIPEELVKNPLDIISTYNNQDGVITIASTYLGNDTVTNFEKLLIRIGDLTNDAQSYSFSELDIYFNDNPQSIEGTDNQDTIRGGRGDDTIDGKAGNDQLNGRNGHDIIYAGSGNDTVHGEHGNDTLIGGSGYDILYGGQGNDTVDGGLGDDIIHASTGNDVLDGGEGIDTVYLSGLRSDLNNISKLKKGGYLLSSLDVQDKVHNIEFIQFSDNTYTSIEDLVTNKARPTANINGVSKPLQDYEGTVEFLEYQHIGSDDSDSIIGSLGNDFFNLGSGDDAAQGGIGDDVLDGGIGSNFLTGDDGNDTFFLDGRNSDITWSTITDFDGDEVNIWGWNDGVSKLLSSEDNAGAEGFKGATLHYDLNNDGTIDTSITFSGLALSEIPQGTANTIDKNGYLAFT